MPIFMCKRFRGSWFRKMASLINLSHIGGWSHYQVLDYEQQPFKFRICHEYGHFSMDCKKVQTRKREQLNANPKISGKPSVGGVVERGEKESWWLIETLQSQIEMEPQPQWTHLRSFNRKKKLNEKHHKTIRKKRIHRRKN